MVRQEDFTALETIVKSAIKDKQKFERVIVTKENLLEMFKYNKYKQHIISSKIADGASTTVYRCGPMVDLCVGPHIPHTGRIKAMAILKVGIVSQALHADGTDLSCFAELGFLLLG